MTTSRLGRRFFARDAPVVAPALLGKLLKVGVCTGRITEVEAYMPGDPASHSFRGMTNRNAVMFGPAGRLYVYFTYGMHHCANIVTGPTGSGQAVLIRAVEPVVGRQLMISRRGRDRNLADGPGKFCQAFAIDLAMNGIDLCATGGDVGVFDDGTSVASPRATQRIGIRVGTDTLWRFTT